MIGLKRTSPEDLDFQRLIKLLDNDLGKRYPLTQHNYTKHNLLEKNVNAVIAYDDGKPVGCGCFRGAGADGEVEIKRMYVVEQSRGRGIATIILRELEKWAVERGENKAILETGIKQPEAVALYEKSGYGRIENYGPYINNKESICMGKDLQDRRRYRRVN